MRELTAGEKEEKVKREAKSEEGTREQRAVYDLLLSFGVAEPAVLSLGETCVAGRWENVSEVREPDTGRERVQESRGGERGRGALRGVPPTEAPRVVCRVGKVGVVVLAEGKTWTETERKLRERFTYSKPLSDKEVEKAAKELGKAESGK